MNVKDRLTPEQIKSLPTPRLLTYYKKYGRYYWPFEGYRGYDDLDPTEKRQYRNLVKYFDSIKDELDTREHMK